ncbi:MAG TPA: SDR family oxidoreductase [Phycisphaerae bacterium]|nr:SDR family oxidoreductase [Phycisphaerae bacterium]
MSLKLKPISEQVFVITGASSGIGMVTARTAARQGAKVVVAARSAQKLNTLVEELQRSGAEALAIKADVSKRDEVEGIAQAAIRQFGRIDTWVNNAGLSIYGRLDEVEDGDSRRLFDINFWGVVNGSLVALQHLRKQGGALINVGSEVSEAVVPLQGMYSASKHAVKGFTDALRVEIEEVDKAPISITLIQPTAVETPFPRHARNYMDREPKLPDPKIDPQKVADAIVEAATKHTHHVKVGMNAKINTFMSNNAPTLADHMAAKYVDKQQTDKSPQQPAGTLYEPGEVIDVLQHA